MKKMKKLMVMLMAATMILAACSKENKVNKKLDGTWNVVSIASDGETMTITSPVIMTIEFGKDKKTNGTYKISQSNGGVSSYSEEGTYTLTSDESISMLSNEAESTAEVFNITDYSKTDLTITNATDATNIIVLKKQ